MGENVGKTAEAILSPLPDLRGKNKKIFDRFAALDIPDDDKDSINVWWRNNKKTVSTLTELSMVTNSPGLPANEAAEVKALLGDGLTRAQATNEQILAFINKPPSLVGQVIGIYTSFFGKSKEEQAAATIAENVRKFDEIKPDMELAVAIGRAIIKTRATNPDDNLIRKKVAQYAFQEIFEQLPVARIAHKEDLDVEISSVIDSPYTEEADLTSCLSSDSWTGEERRKMLRNYERLKTVMKKLGTDTEFKRGLNTLWNWANGQIPEDGSVFKILQKANELDEGVTDSLRDVWNAEIEREEEKQQEEE